MENLRTYLLSLSTGRPTWHLTLNSLKILRPSARPHCLVAKATGGASLAGDGGLSYEAIDLMRIRDSLQAIDTSNLSLPNYSYWRFNFRY